MASGVWLGGGGCSQAVTLGGSGDVEAGCAELDRVLALGARQLSESQMLEIMIGWAFAGVQSGGAERHRILGKLYDIANASRKSRS